MSNHSTDLVTLDLGDQRFEFADPGMQRVLAELKLVVRTLLPILILGETGVGKEVVARAAHHLSTHRVGPFVGVNCAAIPLGLLESELFGYQKGAFSGATSSRAGYFETAGGGTLFLDEIGELSLEAQARLLRVLTERKVARLGSTIEQRVDVRVVAATNRDLDALVQAGFFRQDLYFRLCSATLVIPPLRFRPDDLPRLARQFLSAARTELGRADAQLSEPAMRCVLHHRWPGNVRELKDAMVYAAATAPGDVVELAHLPARIAKRDLHVMVAMDPAAPDAHEFRPIDQEVDELVARRMRQALAATGGVQSAAAALIQMPRRTFVTKMREYRIESVRLRERRALREPGTDS